MNKELPTNKKTLKIMKLFGWILIFFGVIESLKYFSTSNREFLISAILQFFIPGILSLNFNKLISKWQTKALVKDGSYISIQSHYLYTITPDGLHSKSKFSESLLYWSGFQKVIETDTFLFFHLSAAQGFMIPKRAFISPEQGAEFMRLVEHYREQSTGTPVPKITKGAWWTQGSAVTEEETQKLGNQK